jgi:Zn ribbon nucleic-acid-binding protein
MDTACKHPKVRVVAREEDVEYVECLDCGQVFDSNEFRDMEIEEEVFGGAEEEDIR